MAVIVALLDKDKQFDKNRFLDKFNLSLDEIRVVKGGSEKFLVINIPDYKNIDMVELISFDAINHVYDFTKPYKLIHREIKPEGYSLKLKDIEISETTFTPILSFNMEELSPGKIGAQIEDFISKGYNIFYLKNRHISTHEIGIVKDIYSASQEIVILHSINSPNMIEAFSDFIDAFVIEQTHMQNFSLLRSLGKTEKPVIIKKAPAATIDEYLLAVEYIVYEGNLNVILCESGTLTIHNKTIPDIEAILYMKGKTYLPVLLDTENFGTEDTIPYYVKLTKNLKLNGVILDYNRIKLNSSKQIIINWNE